MGSGKDREEKSTLLSKAISLWFALILFELAVCLYLMRREQELSLLPIIADSGARLVALKASVAVAIVTTIAIIIGYLVKRHAIARKSSKG
jgi:hypothetical protein